jgi:hypothetical protein
MLFNMHNLWKKNTNFYYCEFYTYVLFQPVNVAPSVHTYVTTGELLEGFLRNFVLENFTNTC